MTKKRENIKKFLSYIPTEIQWSDIDELLISDNNILRPIRGLSFEFLIDKIFFNTCKTKIYPGSGDSDVDRYFYLKSKKITIQI